MALEGIISEISHTKTNTIWFQLYAQSKTNQTNEQKKTETLTDRQNKRLLEGREAGEQIK